jgi:hypothetical protein
MINSIVHTDEHLSYKCLARNDFVHSSVCHKYEFVSQESGVHMQHVEALNGV